jgi:hypothetical protein
LSQRITGLQILLARDNQYMKNPAGNFAEAVIRIAVLKICRQRMRAFISMAAFDF